MFLLKTLFHCFLAYTELGVFVICVNQIKKHLCFRKQNRSERWADLQSFESLSVVRNHVRPLICRRCFVYSWVPEEVQISYVNPVHRWICVCVCVRQVESRSGTGWRWQQFSVVWTEKEQRNSSQIWWWAPRTTRSSRRASSLRSVSWREETLRYR